MSIAVSLITIFGKPIADKLINTLGNRKDGSQKIEAATAAMNGGLTAIEALKKVFGQDFIAAMNSSIGFGPVSSFSFEAGTKCYIKLDESEISDPVKLLRDELNINLDRLSAYPNREPQMLNHFNGLMSVWCGRFKERMVPDIDKEDMVSTFSTIESVMSGEEKNFREMYKLLSSTALGGIGALLVISGAMIATSTGVGLVAAISTFLFGVPLMTVGALVIPGALMVLLASKNVKPKDTMSISIGLAYKLLERTGKARETKDKLRK